MIKTLILLPNLQSGLLCFQIDVWRASNIGPVINLQISKEKNNLF